MNLLELTSWVRPEKGIFIAADTLLSYTTAFPVVRIPEDEPRPVMAIFQWICGLLNIPEDSEENRYFSYKVTEHTLSVAVKYWYTFSCNHPLMPLVAEELNRIGLREYSDGENTKGAKSL